MSGLLDGVKVLDVTQVVAGSFATMTLADLGAEVVKIERPGSGDLGRTKSPFVDGRSAYFTSVNRNKKSVSLDLGKDEGREAFLRLAEVADVVVENLRPGAMDRLDLGYDEVKGRNEGIVYCSISGFGSSGPNAELPALDIVVQAFGGNMSITGPEEGPPYRSGVPVGDIAGSMYAALSVVAALFYRERTGEGQYVEVPMADGMIAWLTVRAGYTFATGEPYPRMGNRLDEFVPYGVFETEDGHVALAVVGDHHWRHLCEEVDRPDLKEQYPTVEERRENRGVVEGELEEVFLGGSTAEWSDRLAPDLPISPVNDLLEVWESEHVRARGLIADRTFDGVTFPCIDYPASFSRTPTEIGQGAPALGEHTEAELRELGYEPTHLAELRREGVIDSPES